MRLRKLMPFVIPERSVFVVTSVDFRTSAFGFGDAFSIYMTLFRTSANSLGGDTLITAVAVNATGSAGNTLITIPDEPVIKPGSMLCGGARIRAVYRMVRF